MSGDNGGTLQSQFPQQLSTGRPVAATHSAHGLDHSYVWLAINQSTDANPENFSRLCEGDNFPELSMSWQIFVWRSNKLPTSYSCRIKHERGRAGVNTTPRQSLLPSSSCLAALLFSICVNRCAASNLMHVDVSRTSK